MSKLTNNNLDLGDLDNLDYDYTKLQKEAKQSYSYYSRVLEKPFDSLSELRKAEEAYYNEIKAKNDAEACKKADLEKVEEAFKALNASRKAYKADMLNLVEEFSSKLVELRSSFDNSKKALQSILTKAEDTYADAVKAFSEKYASEGYQFTLKDGDTEVTHSATTADPKAFRTLADLAELADLLPSVFSWDLKK